MNENSYRAWLEKTPHTYEIDFQKSVLVPQIENFPEVQQLGNLVQIHHKHWLIESNIPELDLFSQCFIGVMKKHHVPTENYYINQLQKNS
ncbi:hypothetical protein [Liquorilactobacillus satsumensis]|uniref:Uncharacterized protein n=1 Tax=Liquorilactobacillus satsumensis DSM 16230 = JCM 12392 TaxID=1423801 RepID=A0A0R1V1X9_9LACO|nr:hypothetical protein [Liquorilactobacillus satsumensis]KRL96914.1 hypothetical protein FD50_GL001855 [Liquorilactobacillus satsumensis DSM 16230 = JCM 12392]MCC7667803.1 hypothetical protein [Liquorilactobacillus satsumensis]MCP9312426.1 hypothetical protein [Liquorilactobacillus satsumensis]MCP9329012.1 hypothetical protein [Liquorilactobacillus satsumensis]MCP9358565.1 hypothetical protein [Liquorilactobacillus satsumensis]